MVDNSLKNSHECSIRKKKKKKNYKIMNSSPNGKDNNNHKKLMVESISKLKNINKTLEHIVKELYNFKIRYTHDSDLTNEYLLQILDYSNKRNHKSSKVSPSGSSGFTRKSFNKPLLGIFIMITGNVVIYIVAYFLFRLFSYLWKFLYHVIYTITEGTKDAKGTKEGILQNDYAWIIWIVSLISGCISVTLLYYISRDPNIDIPIDTSISNINHPDINNPSIITSVLNVNIPPISRTMEFPNTLNIPIPEIQSYDPTTLKDTSIPWKGGESILPYIPESTREQFKKDLELFNKRYKSLMSHNLEKELPSVPIEPVSIKSGKNISTPPFIDLLESNNNNSTMRKIHINLILKRFISTIHKGLRRKRKGFKWGNFYPLISGTKTRPSVMQQCKRRPRDALSLRHILL